uniref:Uncharacterized protein n=1 Tax=Panagrolaimus sp. PS1159 TaxID=55785 RepID=A0AC35G9G3_9BILA
MSLFLWIGFHPVFKAIVHSQLKLSQADDGQLTKTTFLWSKPPLKNLMEFYVFDVTNIDAVTFFGAKPALIKVGPFGVCRRANSRYLSKKFINETSREIENKKEYQFNEDQTRVWYKNYKTYIYDREMSCDVCNYDAMISIPNLPGLGAYQELTNPKYNLSEFAQQVFGIGVMLLGEYSFVETEFGELVFDGYDDPLLSAAHSELVKFIALAFNYNNTNDEEYWIDTGKNDVNNLGKVITWANLTFLPETWYSSKQSRMINGSDSGTFQHPDLETTDRLQIFMSFLCRSLYMDFSHKTDISGIPTFEFHSPPSVFDTTLEENIGMQYENFEKINYVPNWPNCPPRNTTANCYDSKIDCRIGKNFCHTCCNGSFYNDTFLLPPGLFPVKCYPGKIKEPPFTVFISAPNYAFSPPELVDTVVGLSPKLPDDTPFIYNHEPTSGMVTKVIFQFQISAPIYRNKKFIITSNMANALLPFLELKANGNLTPNALSLIKTSFVTIPLIV